MLGKRRSPPPMNRSDAGLTAVQTSAFSRSPVPLNPEPLAEVEQIPLKSLVLPLPLTNESGPPL